MKTTSSVTIAARASPVVMNCFYFGAASGECRHLANATKACGLAECAMLASDIRENFPVARRDESGAALRESFQKA